MSRKHYTLPFLFLFAVGALQANELKLSNNEVEQDSMRNTDLEAVIIKAYPGEQDTYHETVVQVEPISRKSLRIESLKQISGYISNFFMPEYGSRLTSSIYIRGVGSRLNSPAVGMYVDGMPYVEKNTYDIPLLDVEKIQIIKGPQGTLYGRNTMGGVLNIQTRNPLVSQGIELRVGGSPCNGERMVSLTTNQRLSSKFGIALGGFYKGKEGFFKNDITGRNMDSGNEGGGRIRFVFQPSENLKFDLGTQYSYSHEDAYPYYYTEIGRAHV